MSKWKIFLPVFLLICIWFGKSNCYRLPSSIIPIKYDLKIMTYLDEGGNNDFMFSGKVKILIKCLESTENITLNSKDLRIYPEKTKINSLEKIQHEVLKQESIVKDDFHIIHLKQRLQPSEEYEVSLEFKGVLGDGLLGYYRSSYELNGKKVWLATTQFEPTDARRAFPCFDEPSLKATFTISLGHHRRFKAISNMPLERTEDLANDFVLDTFKESVKMSTYLLAFVVSDFNFVESQEHLSKTAFKIWARKNALNQTHYAAEIGPKALSYFENYFNIHYPLPKQDMIAIPDFNSGAMENWGLITYRETAILFDEKVATARNKYSITNTIAHELAHQWFGNLVTMKWWTDLWLNEGFATYMATLATNHLYPKWDILDTVTISDLNLVYELDSLKSSHPVSVPIKNPSEIAEIFDTISYRKGSFILRMMDLFLGENVLRKGVSNYLKTHAYDNAEQDDLWRALTMQAVQDQVLPFNLTVKNIMDTWTLQTGYPIITAKRNYRDKTVELHQERFYKNAETSLRSPHKQCWWVPISYTNSTEKNFESTKPKLWLSCPKKVQFMQGPSSDSWLILNIKASGLYRVNYDEDNWRLLIDHLKNKHYKDIHVLNRVLLIENSMALATTGIISYEIAFDLISYIKHETESLPWKIALEKLGAINNYLKRTSNYGTFKKYKANLVEEMYEKVGGFHVNPEKRNSLSAISHQVRIVSAACSSGLEKCTTEAENLFQKWMSQPDGPNPIPQDMRGIIYCEAIKNGNEVEWEFLWNKYKTSNVGTEKITILGSLTCTNKVWLLSRFLEWTLDKKSGIRNQDTFSVFSGIADNEVGYFVAKNFLEENIGRIYNWISSKKYRMGQYIKSIAKGIKTEKEQTEFTKFIEENSKYFDQAKYAVQQALELVEINIQWQKNYYDLIEKILKNITLVEMNRKEHLKSIMAVQPLH